VTVGASQATASAFLSAVFQATAFSYAGLWVKLHVGDPGSAGTANPAGETTRMNASACFGTAPALVSGYMQIQNDAEIGPIASVSTTETYSHVSFWTDPTAGTFAGSGTITAASVTAGDPFSVPIGDCTARQPVAA
jgi:hypothetical protein